MLLLLAPLLPALLLLPLLLLQSVLLGWEVPGGGALGQSTCGWMPPSSSTPTVCRTGTQKAVQVRMR
jgi:hypothetical protein